jgi:hexosaminidase
MKTNRFIVLITIVMMQIGVSCNKPIATDLAQESLIPWPVEVKSTGSSFTVKPNTVIYVPDGSDELRSIGDFLASQMAQITGLSIQVVTGETTECKGICLSLGAENEVIGTEGYLLDITEKGVVLKANQPEGVFRGSQTLLQLLRQPENGKLAWMMASGSITDYPQYSYRGAMLDVSRHFFGIDDVKRYIDLMAEFKLNILHLHLSDDQGWRIEIKSWPNLTLYGSTTQVGGGAGGFYTQEEYREIIQYAKARYITVIPEIDMPGHTNAASASYPELNGAKEKAELYTGIKVGFSTFDTRKEVTYQFVDDVIRELAEMTEGPYIHIGGDESHVTKEPDYIYFINRVQEIVKKYGKTMIGWDEIAHADITPEAIVQYWAKDKNAIMGVQKGAKVIMSPSTKAYLDMKYDSTTHIGLKWAGYIEVDTAYLWNPATLVPGINRENILGVESPLWTETVTNMDELEYLVFPRLMGHAEIGWSPVEVQNWENYKVRLAKYGKRLKEKSVDFYPSPKVEWETAE